MLMKIMSNFVLVDLHLLQGIIEDDNIFPNFIIIKSFLGGFLSLWLKIIYIHFTLPELYIELLIERRL